MDKIVYNNDFVGHGFELPTCLHFIVVVTVGWLVMMLLELGGI